MISNTIYAIVYNDIRVQFVWVDSDLELTTSRNFYMCAWEMAVAHVCGGQRQPQVVPWGGGTYFVF